MKKLAVLGAGALSHTFCLNAGKHLSADYFITAVYDKHYASAVDLSTRIGSRACESVEEMLELQPEIVVEFAGPTAVQEYGEAILDAGADLILASAGSLDNEKFRNKLIDLARHYGRTIFLTSGAIGGMDIMTTFHVYGDPQVSVISTKPPEYFDNAPYLDNKPAPRDKEVVLYDGDVDGAIKGFQHVLNVSIATELATGAKDMKVKLISKPGITRQVHEIKLHNPIMDADMTFSSEPSKESIRSSEAAAWSAIALLKDLASPLIFF